MLWNKEIHLHDENFGIDPMDKKIKRSKLSETLIMNRVPIPGDSLALKYKYKGKKNCNCVPIILHHYESKIMSIKSGFWRKNKTINFLTFFKNKYLKLELNILKITFQHFYVKLIFLNLFASLDYLTWDKNL